MQNVLQAERETEEK